MEKLRDFTTASLKAADALLSLKDQTEQDKTTISDDQFALCSFINELNQALRKLAVS